MTPLRISRRAVLAGSALALPLAMTWPVRAAEESFEAFLESVRRLAESRGIRQSTINAAFRATRFLPHVMELDRHQPERVMTFGEYISKVVTPEREQNARRHLVENRRLLDAISRRWRVSPRVIVALWGIESDFGSDIGDYPVPSAVATLAYGSGRGTYFRGELIAALRILDDRDIGIEEMTGSWAGAMGQCQFMPSTYLAYAVDYDGDGRRDIWGDRADVLASVANFISRLGWHAGENWGEEVVLPAGFDARFAGLGIRRPMSQWRRMGVRASDGAPLADRRREASLILPGGSDGPALLVSDNFRTILRWNNSTYFATAVGYLADSMARG